MTQEAFAIIAAFFAVAAAALAIQAGMLYGIYKSSREMRQEIKRLLPKIETLLDSSAAAVADVRDVAAKSTEVLNVTRTSLQYVDANVRDITAHVRHQFDRAEKALDETVRRTHDTLALLQSGVMKPIREVNGVAKGIRAALHFLAGGAKPPGNGSWDRS